MKILLTNDDGYLAEGINVLKERLEEDGHEVWICAPCGQRSSFSHAMTFRRKVWVYRHGDRIYSCSGSPADSIIYGLGSGLLPKDFDLVISGINNGYNRSSDLVYSGTAGAAREACLSGYRAMAVSAAWKGEDAPEVPFTKAAEFVARNLQKLYEYTGENYFLNINVPYKGSLEEWGVADTDSVIHYKRYMHTDWDEEAKGYLCTVYEDDISHSDSSPVSDFALTDNGIISLSIVDALPHLKEGVQDRLRKEKF